MTRDDRSPGRVTRWPLVSLLAAACTLGACSGTTPTAATTETTTTPAASVSPAVTLLTVGQSQTYALSAAAAEDMVTWTSSNDTVLAIDATGAATGAANGTATLTATSTSGLSATLTVQVIPVYQGTWKGAASALACTDLAGFASAGYCSRLLGTSQPMTLTLTQSGYSVSGSVIKVEGSNSVNGSVSGGVGTSGELLLSGTLGGLVGAANTTVTVFSWNSMADGSNMTGAWAANIASPQIPGLATAQWTLTDMVLVP